MWTRSLAPHYDPQDRATGACMSYDPSISPDPAHWMAMTEEERLIQVVEYHERTKVTLPNARLHAALHVTVENQIAQQYAPTVEALARLTGEGLPRHEALHAIAEVVVNQLHQLIQRGAPEFDEAAYERELALLTAQRWKADAG